MEEEEGSQLTSREHTYDSHMFPGSNQALLAASKHHFELRSLPTRKELSSLPLSTFVTHSFCDSDCIIASRISRLRVPNLHELLGLVFPIIQFHFLISGGIPTPITIGWSHIIRKTPIVPVIIDIILDIPCIKWRILNQSRPIQKSWSFVFFSTVRIIVKIELL